MLLVLKDGTAFRTLYLASSTEPAMRDGPRMMWIGGIVLVVASTLLLLQPSCSIRVTINQTDAVRSEPRP